LEPEIAPFSAALLSYNVVKRLFYVFVATVEIIVEFFEFPLDNAHSDIAQETVSKSGSKGGSKSVSTPGRGGNNNEQWEVEWAQGGLNDIPEDAVETWEGWLNHGNVGLWAPGDFWDWWKIQFGDSGQADFWVTAYDLGYAFEFKVYHSDDEWGTTLTLLADSGDLLYSCIDEWWVFHVNVDEGDWYFIELNDFSWGTDYTFMAEFVGGGGHICNYTDGPYHGSHDSGANGHLITYYCSEQGCGAPKTFGYTYLGSCSTCNSGCNHSYTDGPHYGPHDSIADGHLITHYCSGQGCGASQTSGYAWLNSCSTCNPHKHSYTDGPHYGSHTYSGHSETYYCSVQGSSCGAAQTSYVSDPYCSVCSDNYQWENEPNDYPEEANETWDGCYNYGWIGYIGGNTDWWKVRFESSGQANFWLYVPYNVGCVEGFRVYHSDDEWGTTLTPLADWANPEYYYTDGRQLLQVDIDADEWYFIEIVESSYREYIFRTILYTSGYACVPGDSQPDNGHPQHWLWYEACVDPGCTNGNFAEPEFLRDQYGNYLYGEWYWQNNGSTSGTHNNTYNGHAQAQKCSVSGCAATQTAYVKLLGCYICYPHNHIWQDNGSPSSNHTSGLGHAQAQECSVSGCTATQTAYVPLSNCTICNPPITMQKTVVSGQEYDFVISAENLTNFSGITYTFSYDTSKFTLVDACALTWEKNITTGLVSGTDITIMSISSGTIVFKCDKPITSGSFTGAVNIIKLKAIGGGSAWVSIGTN